MLRGKGIHIEPNSLWGNMKISASMDQAERVFFYLLYACFNMRFFSFFIWREHLVIETIKKQLLF